VAMMVPSSDILEAEAAAEAEVDLCRIAFILILAFALN
jgi:hypothetical protein